jgi:hypothetical protein
MELNIPFSNRKMNRLKAQDLCVLTELIGQYQLLEELENVRGEQCASAFSLKKSNSVSASNSSVSVSVRNLSKLSICSSAGQSQKEEAMKKINPFLIAPSDEGSNNF